MSVSDTSNVRRLRAGDSEAAQALWRAYFKRLVGLARRILQGAPTQAADEEDVALSAFDSFCRGVERGRFPRLDDRDCLWRILLVITRRKAFDLLRSEGRTAARQEEGPDDLPGPEPTPEFAALMADQCRALFRRLGDPGLEEVARDKMEGYTNEEIAARRRCSLSSVERKLRLIRKLWRPS